MNALKAVELMLEGKECRCVENNVDYRIRDRKIVWERSGTWTNSKLCNSMCTSEWELVEKEYITEG